MQIEIYFGAIFVFKIANKATAINQLSTEKQLSQISNTCESYFKN